MSPRVLCFLVLVAVVAKIQCNSEGDALNAWKSVLSDPNNVLQSWDPTLVNPCTWFHITCNNENSVIRVDLGNAGLSGPLVSELGSLTNLQYLNVFGNRISGLIPSVIGNLTSLISLELQQNQLSGSIPSSLGNLASLNYLKVFGNRLSGSIPPVIGNLTSLIGLELQQNQLSGSIPSTLGNLGSLKYLRLYGNNLTGNLPLAVIGLIQLGNLKIIDVADNMLTGTVHRTNTTGYAITRIIQDPKAPNLKK